MRFIFTLFGGFGIGSFFFRRNASLGFLRCVATFAAVELGGGLPACESARSVGEWPLCPRGVGSALAGRAWA